MFTTYSLADQTIKIGLYFKSNSKSQIEITNDKGVSFSAYDSAANNYAVVYSSGTGKIVTIRKDSYYNISEQKFTSAAENGNPSVGPYHIEIKNTLNTYKEILPIIKSYIEKGVVAYPVFTDTGWKIWTGFYINKKESEKAIPIIKTKLGENTYTVIGKSDKRIYGVNSSGIVKSMFASEKKLL